MNNFSCAVGVLGAAIGIFLGGYDGFVYALLIFVIIDYVTGILSSIKTKNISSEVGFWGLVKKTITFCIVGMANILDVYVFGFDNVIRTAVIFFFVSNEGISILENVTVLGLKVPVKLKDMLIQLNKDKDDEK